MRQRPGGRQPIPRPSRWQPGDVPSWVHSTPLPRRAADVVAAVAAARLDQEMFTPLFDDARASAVLVVVADGAEGAEVLLTKRSQHLRNHAGEISFPGGRMDPGETAVQAALREAAEEVDLAAQHVDVVGQLSHLSTFVSRSYIVPFVARLTASPHPPLAARTAEVERILWVPLAELARADTYRLEHWGDPPVAHPMHFFELDDETIWGATGRMLFELVDLVYGPPAIRTAL